MAAVPGDMMTPNTRVKKMLNVPKDLLVRFDDDQVVEAHALILVLASPILRDMLTDDDGSLRKELNLPGKAAHEFEIFQQALLPASLRFAALTDEATYFILCRWAHEYEVDALRTLCEDHLIKSVAVCETSLAHALEFNLVRRRAQCIAEMKQDLPRYVDSLGLLATPMFTSDLEALWPLLCTEAGIDAYEMPPVTTVAAMWPFVAASIRKEGMVSELTSGLKKVVTEQVLTASEMLSGRAREVVIELNDTASSWTSGLYKSFWQQAEWAQGRIKSYYPQAV